MENMPDDPKLTTRRSFLNLFLGGTIATTIIGALAPIVAYVYPPKSSENSNNPFSDVDLKPILADAIPENSGVVGILNNKNTILIKKEGKLYALSAVCTHLGCSVKWDNEQNLIKCPCHGAKFDLNGRILSGPPPKPLELIKIEVIDNQIISGGEG